VKRPLLKRSVTVAVAASAFGLMLANPALASSQRCAQAATGPSGLDTIQVCIEWGVDGFADAQTSYFTSTALSSRHIYIGDSFSGPFTGSPSYIGADAVVAPGSVLRTNSDVQADPAGSQAWAAVGTVYAGSGGPITFQLRLPSSGYLAF